MQNAQAESERLQNSIKTSRENKVHILYDFDALWTCPNCGRQDQSEKCSGCGLTKGEVFKIWENEIKQNNEFQ